MAVVLNDEQISRIYDEYDFGKNEKIVSATWYRNCNCLTINYKDKDNYFISYDATIDINNANDNAKINYILHGNIEDNMFWDDMETGILDDDEEDF